MCLELYILEGMLSMWLKGSVVLFLYYHFIPGSFKFFLISSLTNSSFSNEFFNFHELAYLLEALFFAVNFMFYCIVIIKDTRTYFNLF